MQIYSVVKLSQCYFIAVDEIAVEELSAFPHSGVKKKNDKHQCRPWHTPSHGPGEAAARLDRHSTEFRTLGSDTEDIFWNSC